MKYHDLKLQNGNKKSYKTARSNIKTSNRLLFFVYEVLCVDTLQRGH